MKNTTKIFLLVFALVLLSFSLVGCLFNTEDKLYAEDRFISYIGYTCAAPSDADSFAFTLKESEDGSVEFTAWCTSDGGEKIVLTGVTVDKSELETVRGIAEKHALSDFMMADNSSGVTERKEIAPDETLYSLLIKWKNGSSHQADSAYLAADDLHDFLFDLAERTMNK